MEKRAAIYCRLSREDDNLACDEVKRKHSKSAETALRICEETWILCLLYVCG